MDIILTKRMLLKRQRYCNYIYKVFLQENKLNPFFYSLILCCYFYIHISDLEKEVIAISSHKCNFNDISDAQLLQYPGKNDGHPSADVYLQHNKCLIQDFCDLGPAGLNR